MNLPVFFSKNQMTNFFLSYIIVEMSKTRPEGGDENVAQVEWQKKAYKTKGTAPKPH